MSSRLHPMPRFALLTIILIIGFIACTNPKMNFHGTFQRRPWLRRIHHIPFTADMQTALFIQVNMGTLGLQPGNYSFDLGLSPAGIQVKVHEFAEPASQYYCSTDDGDLTIQKRDSSGWRDHSFPPAP